MKVKSHVFMDTDLCKAAKKLEEYINATQCKVLVMSQGSQAETYYPDCGPDSPKLTKTVFSYTLLTEVVE